ncbi:MAG: hypothetical protein ACLQNG_16480, partial [Acidimicrobiales bacterium]
MGIRTDLDERQRGRRPAAGIRALLQWTVAAASALVLLMTVATPAWAAGAALSPSFAGYQGPVGAKGTATIKVPAITCVAPTQFVAATVYLNDTA